MYKQSDIFCLSVCPSIRHSHPLFLHASLTRIKTSSRPWKMLPLWRPVVFQRGRARRTAGDLSELMGFSRGRYTVITGVRWGVEVTVKLLTYYIKLSASPVSHHLAVYTAELLPSKGAMSDAFHGTEDRPAL